MCFLFDLSFLYARRKTGPSDEPLQDQQAGPVVESLYVSTYHDSTHRAPAPNRLHSTAMQLSYLVTTAVALWSVPQSVLAVPVREVMIRSYVTSSGAPLPPPAVHLLRRTDEITEELLPGTSSPPKSSAPSRTWSFVNALGTPSSPKGDAATRRWRKQRSQLHRFKEGFKAYPWKQKVKSGLVGTGRCVKNCLHTIFIDD